MIKVKFKEKLNNVNIITLNVIKRQKNSKNKLVNWNTPNKKNVEKVLKPKIFLKPKNL